jgi:hypothetical protein
MRRGEGGNQGVPEPVAVLAKQHGGQQLPLQCYRRSGSRCSGGWVVYGSSAVVGESTGQQM